MVVRPMIRSTARLVLWEHRVLWTFYSFLFLRSCCHILLVHKYIFACTSDYTLLQMFLAGPSHSACFRRGQLAVGGGTLPAAMCTPRTTWETRLTSGTDRRRRRRSRRAHRCDVSAFSPGTPPPTTSPLLHSLFEDVRLNINASAS